MNRRTFLISAASAGAAAMLPLPSLALESDPWVHARLVYPGMMSDGGPGIMNWQCSLAYWREKVVPYINEGWELAFLDVKDD